MMTREELNKAVAEYRSLKAMKDELDEQIKAAEKEIIQYMTEQNKTKEIGETTKSIIATAQERRWTLKGLKPTSETLTNTEKLQATSDSQ